MTGLRRLRPLPSFRWDDDERRLVAACLCRGTVAGLAVDQLSDRGRAWVDVVGALERKRAPFEAETIVSEARSLDALEALGGVAGIADVLAERTTDANLEYFAAQIRERAARRRFGEIVEDAAAADTRSTAVRAADVMGQLGPLALADDDAPVESSLDVALRWSDRFERRRVGEAVGLRVGLRLFDGLDLLVPGSLVVIGARPSVGKTALAAWLALQVAAVDGAFVATCEMSSEDFMGRLVAAVSRLDLRLVNRPRSASQSELERLHNASARLGEIDLHLWGPASATVERLEAAAVARHAARPFGLVAVDYIQLIAERRRGETDEASVARVSRTLKRIARRLGVCVVALSQLNRGNERDGRAPRLSDLRSSGAIEQDADVCVLLHRPGRIDGERPADWLDLDVAKHRNGPLGIRRVRYDLETQRFQDFEDGSEAMEDLRRQLHGGTR